jgi:murein DD-endopeptidase MepM/ murein hydrolase activator NlpD
MLVLAGTVAFGAMIPVAPAALASYDETPASTQTVTAPDQFDIAADGGLVGLTAIVHAGTGGADLLEDPAHDATPLLRLDDGTVVNLRVDMADTVYDPDGATRWWPVEVNGQDGWISGFFLVDPEIYTAQRAVSTDDKAGEVTTATPNRVPYDYTGSMVAEVSADGDGLVMRSEPDASSAEVTSLQDGVIVDLRIDALDTVYDAQGTRWWPVSFDGFEGWVSGFYLIEPGTEPVVTEAPAATTTPTPAATQAPAETDTLVVGDWAVITTPNGNGVNLLAAPNAEADQSGFAPNQGLVEILADAGNGWFQVRWDDQTGYIDGALLTETQGPQRAGNRTAQPTATTAPSETPAATEAPASNAAFVEGDEVEVQPESGVGINMRAEPGVDAERVGFLDDGVIVEVTAGPLQDDEGNDWYSVTDGDQSGWVRADLIGRVGQTTQAVAEVAANTASSTARNASTGFILPVENFRFTQDFGCSSLGFYSYDPSWGCSIHDGVDLAATSGTPLLAVGDGTVVAAGWCDCGLGFYVELDHGDGLHTVYGHMASQPYVSVGQQVTQGTVLGPVGSSGLSTGPHVHFMVRQDGVTQDPKNYLPAIN